MSAAIEVLSGPSSLSNSSPLTCANTCGQAARAAVNNSSSRAREGPPDSRLVPSNTHSPYGSGLSIGSIGFTSRDLDLAHRSLPLGCGLGQWYGALLHEF